MRTHLARIRQGGGRQGVVGPAVVASAPRAGTRHAPDLLEEEPLTPTARACSHCRQAFPTRRSLRRHEAMDHLAAPDGARLTARLFDAREPDRRPQALPEPAGGVRRLEPLAPEARQEPTEPSPAPPAWPLLLVLLVVALLVGPASVAAVWLAALTVALWWRYDHLGRERRGPGRSP